MASSYRLVPLDDASTDEDNDLWYLATQVDDLFDDAGIRMMSYDEAFSGIESGGKLVAALVAGSPYNDPFTCYRFSVAVAPEHRRKGLAKRLIEDFVSFCESQGFAPEAWVVNESAMVPLLEDLGFSKTDEALWGY